MHAMTKCVFLLMCCGLTACTKTDTGKTPPKTPPKTPKQTSPKPKHTKSKTTKETNVSNKPSGYKTPPESVTKLIEAAPTPILRKSPDGQHIALIHYTYMPSLELLAQPFDRLAGLRITQDLGLEQRLYNFTALSIMRLPDKKELKIDIPTNSKRLALVTWSDDSKQVAYTILTEQGMELWRADASTGKATRVGDMHINDAIGAAFVWMPDNQSLLVRTRVGDKRPAPPLVPSAPIIEETAKREAKNRTYQDLLETPYDDELFAFYTTHQLEVVGVDGKRRKLGTPGIFTSTIPSPDGKYLIVKRLKQPFSHAVPYGYFAHTLEIWDTKTGDIVATMADEPAKEEVPIQGVPTGPRRMRWHSQQDATLLWVEALDGGDPNKKADHRDQMMISKAPFTQKNPLLKTTHRYNGISWLDMPNRAMVSEYDRDRRWISTHLYDLTKPEKPLKTIFDRSVADQYNNPGSPLYKTRPNGTSVIRVVDNKFIYLAGKGATPEGDRPFLDKMNLETLEKQRLFHSPKEAYTSFAGFGPKTDAGQTWVIRRESPTEPPNYYLRTPDGKETTLTAFPNPHPQLTGIKKKLLTYKRKDGVPLSGTLYLPPSYKEGDKLPVILWAYPRSYTDAKTAGQVRAAPNRFTRLSGTSPLMFLTQGYAVLDDATIPVVGDPKNMNDTFVPQITEAAQAAIEALKKEGNIDITRVGVAGHSYGAFMVANLLAHTEIFAAGIARSGAYNRSLTPFGFQRERRTLWEATDTYIQVSPLFHADKLKEPILLIHGDADNNSGTYPLQSKRLFHALKGLGGTAKLVLLPHESHGYRAKESVLHVLAESFEWADKYIKNAKPKK